jgi:hypothetical protein
MESVIVIPVTVAKDTPRIGLASLELTPRSMKDLGLVEADLEEFVRKNVQLLFPEGDETLLIVGQQARNVSGGRSDLVAIDSNGAIVLIELKRDAAAISARKEPFEFQAIRYAANYADLTSDTLLERLFGPYVERYRKEFGVQELTSHELARRILDNFLDKNNAMATFNGRQRIVLIAADFDPQTLSACAWLAKNSIDIRCLRLQPYEFSDQVLLFVEQLIPPPRLEDYFVRVADAGGVAPAVSNSSPSARQALPRMNQIIEWGLVSPGDTVYIRGIPEKPARILDANRVRENGHEMTLNDWGKSVTGWSAINIYEWTIDKKSGKTLDALRRQKLADLEGANGASQEGSQLQATVAG